MIAIQYRKSVPRYLALRSLGPRWPAVYTSSLSPVTLCELPEPKLPTPCWVRVRPILSGICGSDLATVCAKGSAYFSPLTSTPFVLGHEVVGRVTEVGPHAEGVAVGDRVVLQPALGCRVRGIEPMCEACTAGRLALCRNVTRGDISAGIQTGFCRDTGGTWSESFVAHPSQLYRVPDGLDDEVAVLTEPFACAMHAVLRARGDFGFRISDFGVGNRAGDAELQQSKTQNLKSKIVILVVGCGSIGLLVIAAIRALDLTFWGNSAPRVVAVGKHAHQREHALTLGADEVLPSPAAIEERYAIFARALGAEVHRPEIGKPTVVGGADVTFDCVASATSIDDCLRFTAAGGRMVLVGMPAIPKGIDWTTIWYKELSVQAAYAYGREDYLGRTATTFELALGLLVPQGPKLRNLVGPPVDLHDYRGGLCRALSSGRAGTIKTVFKLAT